MAHRGTRCILGRTDYGVKINGPIPILHGTWGGTPATIRYQRGNVPTRTAGLTDDRSPTPGSKG